MSGLVELITENQAMTGFRTSYQGRPETGQLAGQGTWGVPLGQLWPALIDWNPRGLAAGPVDQLMKKAAGLATKLLVLWQWSGRYFEH